MYGSARLPWDLVTSTSVHFPWSRTLQASSSPTPAHICASLLFSQTCTGSLRIFLYSARNSIILLPPLCVIVSCPTDTPVHLALPLLASSYLLLLTNHLRLSSASSLALRKHLKNLPAQPLSRCYRCTLTRGVANGVHVDELHHRTIVWPAIAYFSFGLRIFCESRLICKLFLNWLQIVWTAFTVEKDTWQREES